MKNDYSLTATYHPPDFNRLSPGEFANLCHWLADDTGEYKSIEYYDAPGDKKRDVIGHTHENKEDYFQCKRYKNAPTFADLKKELDDLVLNIKSKQISSPRRVYFVLSTSASPSAKDNAKKYALKNGLPEPDFWEPNILDKKIWKSKIALKKFFNIDEDEQEEFPEVNVEGEIAYSTDDYRFKVVNNGQVTAVDCEMYLLGFGQNYKMPQGLFNLKPLDSKEVRMGIPGDFLKLVPWKELKIRFVYRNSKNKKYYSERLLNISLVPAKAFYIIDPIPGDYIPAQTLTNVFSIVSIDRLDPTGLNKTRLVSYNENSVSRVLKINISTTLEGMWQLSEGEIEAAFRELSERRIMQMIHKNEFEEEYYVNSYLKDTRKTGFEAYKELRDSIILKEKLGVGI